MATSNAFTTSNDNILYEIEVIETATDVTNNTSTINVKVNAWSTKQGFSIDYDGECYLKINGESKTHSSWLRTQKPIIYNYTNKVTIYNASFTIEHTENGTKSIQVAAFFELFFDGHVKLTSSYKSYNINLTSFDIRSTNLEAVGTLSIDGNTDKLMIYADVYDNAYSHTLVLFDGNTTVLTVNNLILSKGHNEYTLTANDKSAISAYMYGAGITSFVGTYTLTTYAGAVQIGNTSTCVGTVRTLLSNGSPLIEFRSGSVKVNGSFEQTTPNMEIRDNHILKQLRW